MKGGSDTVKEETCGGGYVGTSGEREEGDGEVWKWIGRE